MLNSAHSQGQQEQQEATGPSWSRPPTPSWKAISPHWAPQARHCKQPQSAPVSYRVWMSGCPSKNPCFFSSFLASVWYCLSLHSTC